MSILIKGMKMPTERAWVDVRIFRDGTAIVTEERAHRTNRQAIELPPHGRLIDADELRQSFRESIDECHKWANEIEGGEMYARVSQSLGTFLECSLRVKSAPTIIEAESAE